MRPPSRTSSRSSTTLTVTFGSARPGPSARCGPGEAASALRRMLATERGRGEPPLPDEAPQIDPDDAAEVEIRAALLAVTEGRYVPAIPPEEPYPWVSDDQ